MLEEALEGSPEDWGGQGQHAFPGVSSERDSLLSVCRPRASSYPQFLHPPCWAVSCCWDHSGPGLGGDEWQEVLPGRE